MVTDGEVAHVALQTNPTAANVNIARVIALCSYHIVIAMWRAKEAECAARELLGNNRSFTVNSPPFRDR
jgi:hypothetical protein